MILDFIAHIIGTAMGFVVAVGIAGAIVLTRFTRRD